MSLLTPPRPAVPALALLGDDVRVPVLGGGSRRSVDLDAAATTPVSRAVQRAVEDHLPWYSSVHRGAGAKSRWTSERYDAARETVRAFVGADAATHHVVFPRGTTEALNLLAHRLRLAPDDVVVSTAAEHHANLLPWRRYARVRLVDVAPDGTFGVEDVVRALEEAPRPRVLAVTGASNVTGWVPPLAAIAAQARRRGVLVVVDGAQLVPHRPVDMATTGIDVLAFSGHKMFAPYGAGALVVPRAVLDEGEPFLVGGGAVAAVGDDDVVWAEAPARDEAGTPNVLGVVALAAAVEERVALGWDAVLAHEADLRAAIDAAVAAVAAVVPGVRRLGPTDADRLPVAALAVDGVPHGLLAARLADEHAVSVRSGCFCAHPLMARLLRLTPEEVARVRDDARAGRADALPGAVRVSAHAATSLADVETLAGALREVLTTPERGARWEPDGRGGFVPRAGRDPRGPR
ncbi:aminotransferase class V-fold PLP-dependent enzyme [Cellulomonas endophytica]|uniref:aminotransferase class V-fold PLP-dependent enzyme n=1 Tax=Cellulomonas endophytica TaxID=2494735 RepID=UPI00196ADBFA|nr:aminotransferase class V-fold PLP-dependent enzyme [Cellulomonas endophytica]